jgi:phage shock protein C
MKTLRLSKDKKIAGVCAGVAEYFAVDPTLVRVIWLVAALGFGTGFLAYVVCWLLMAPALDD